MHFGADNKYFIISFFSQAMHFVPPASRAQWFPPSGSQDFLRQVKQHTFFLKKNTMWNIFSIQSGFFQNIVNIMKFVPAFLVLKCLKIILEVLMRGAMRR